MKYFKPLILVVAIVTCTGTMAQEGTARLIDWKFLAQVKFEDKYYPEYEAWYLYPVFPQKLKEVDGRQVIIKGYVIPLDVEDGVYALSAYPFSSCFFCGGAGPESVMSLKFKGSAPEFETDDVATFTGTLHLNDSNLDDFNYVLRNASVISK